jgi:hypothetical protein
MFGARRSVTALFMMRRSTKHDDAVKSEFSKEESKFSMLSQANKQPVKKDIEVVDITDDMQDILGNKK